VCTCIARHEFQDTSLFSKKEEYIHRAHLHTLRFALLTHALLMFHPVMQMMSVVVAVTKEVEGHTSLEDF
jgi:hypothetical protein